MKHNAFTSAMPTENYMVGFSLMLCNLTALSWLTGSVDPAVLNQAMTTPRGMLVWIPIAVAQALLYLRGIASTIGVAKGSTHVLMRRLRLRVPRWLQRDPARISMQRHGLLFTVVQMLYLMAMATLMTGFAQDFYEVSLATILRDRETLGYYMLASVFFIPVALHAKSAASLPAAITHVSVLRTLRFVSTVMDDFGKAIASLILVLPPRKL